MRKAGHSKPARISALSLCDFDAEQSIDGWDGSGHASVGLENMLDGLLL